MEFYASCPEGFESALADELKRLGLSHVRRLKGRATFEGELEEGYRACLWSRLASRVFVVLGRFEAQDADELYDSVYDIAWETIIRPGATIAITARGVTEQLRNMRFSALRAKDALCDRLAETTGRRADVDAADPDVHLLLSLRQRRASISLDLSGDPLFKRLPPAATRAGEGAHVLRPDYAALVLAQVGWTALCERELTVDDYENEALPTLIDASCADGGLLLEAVNILTDRAPGAARERWGFEGWQLHDAALWEQLLAEAREREAAARERQARIVAADIDPAARKTAERMVKSAGYKRFVDFCAAKPATVLDHAGAVAGAAVVADTTETPLSLMHDAMTLVGELRRAPELASAPVAALTRDGLMARALHAEPARSIAVMPNNEEAAIEVWPSLDHAAAAFEAATSADAEAEVADANEANDEAAASSMPEPTATLDLGDGKPLPVLIPESEQFANRLRKNARLRRKWAKREGVSCYRVYDADLPDYSAAIDLYEGCPQTPGRWLVIAEYAAPKTIDPALAQARMLDILAIAPRILDVPAEHVHAKARMRSRGGSQYGKQGAGKGASGERANIARRRLPLIEEGGLTFAVNFDDYLDVGIFLDHRVTRNLVREHAKQARRFLNLFAYTGTATCYAADGGVEETVTVDLSNTYLDWAERNMRQNGFVGPQHHFVRDDVLAWIRDQRQTRNRWDLIFVDPPTFSNSSKMGRRTWDVQRDHVELLAGVSRLLAQGGHAIFSCNLRGFRPETRKLARAGVVLEDITAQTIPEDFARNRKVHHCYIVRRLPIEDAMAEVGFSAEEIAERTEELRNPRRPQAPCGSTRTCTGRQRQVQLCRQTLPRRQAQKEEVLRQQAQGQVNKVAVEYGLFCLELGKFRPYFTATHIGMVVGDLALGDQSVTDTHMRLDIARVRGVGLNLLAQRAHKDAQARQVALSCRAPNLVQDKLVRQYLVGVVCQQAQELVLDRRQMQLLAIHRGDAGIKIDMQLTGIERALGDNAARLRIRKAPERRANAREQLLDRKRLGQVVVGAGIECTNLVRILAARRNHNNRHTRPCAHRLHHLDTIHIGQAQIEQHNTRCLR